MNVSWSRNWIALLLFSLGIPASAAAEPGQRTESYRFEFQAGDTLIARNDYGRVRIQAWNKGHIEVTVRTITVDTSRLEDVETVANRVADKIFVESYFYDYEADSVYIDVQAPAELDLVVWGANPAVEILGISGSVRAHTLTGFITAEDLENSTSLLSRQGNILYTGRVQPQGDLRFETVTGNVICRLAPTLNLRSWMRAGRRISWNRELELSQGSLEKQVGVGGPLLLAASQQGDVTIEVTEVTRDSSMDTLPEQALSRRAGTRAPRRESSPPSEPGGAPPRLEAKEELPAARTTQPDDSKSLPSPVREIDPAPTGSEYALKVHVDWVYVNASVRDRYTNRAVPYLQQEDFLIYENGEERPVEHFESTEAPFNLLLLLDVSGSTRSHMDMIQDASINFVREIGLEDRIALATFNSDTRLRQDFTNDRAEIREAIGSIRSGGGTAFYDALHRSVSRYMEGIEGRKAIVVFTDGVDNRLTGDYGSGSRLDFRDLYREIQEEDVLIYTIFLDTEAEAGIRGGRRGGGSIGGILGDIILGRGGGLPGIGPGDPAYVQAKAELSQVAEQTGGRFYEPRAIYDLDATYSEIADDLRVQYTLGYHAAPGGADEWREIEVEIKNREDLAVRARRGYYAGSP